ncbi:DUF6286 domain-containing protein [Streptomyces sp. NBC_01190]|uniref:DUF6286 domain-containing protein n=1 Tax=Streptomyces sp. NBC_01190 TaxID=2903767 RepID=UPI0038654766|nr:DUF6286 domain-containing protein [Streptomyces sp. NBC_01190]
MSHLDPAEGSDPDREPARDRPAAAGLATTVPEPAGAHQEEQPDQQAVARDAKRFWAERRVPAAITALPILGLAVLFLVDVINVRAGNKAMSWRRSLAHQLATRHLDDTWIILGASVCAAIGLWLLVLACTPGLGEVLPMARRGPTGIRAGLDRRAAALVVRDRAMEVPGVRWAKVTVGRRRVRVHVASHFRDLTDVRQDMDAAVAEAVRQLGLARQPRLRVRVQRADKNT